MISVDYCHLFARYSAWQNTSLVDAADTLTDAERWLDRGAFFKSIAATMNHVYWADALMLARINGDRRPQDTIAHSLTHPSLWPEFKVLRNERDNEIAAWAAKLTDADMEGTVAWYSPSGTDLIEMPKSLAVIQLFNHQTHHRGQIHAMLTAAGATPEVTDIAAMP